MSINKQNNKFLSLLFTFLSFFILLIFSKDIFYKLQENLDIKGDLTQKISSKNTELIELEKLEKELGTDTEKRKYISPFLSGFTEDEILIYLNNYIEDINKGNPVIVINNLSFTEEKQSEIGFKESGVNISLKVANKQTLKDFLTFLTSPNSKYRFFITDFSFPNEFENGIISIEIPLKLFHK